MSESIEVVATFQAKAGQGDQLAAAVTAVLETVRAEDGCLRYDFYRVRRDDEAFVMLEEWASKNALQAHGETETFQTLMRQLGDVVAEPPVIRFLAPLEPA